MDNNKDSQGIIVKKSGIVIMVIGIIVSMITFFNSPITSILIVAIVIFIEILLYALGEIIILLQEIRDKL